MNPKYKKIYTCTPVAFHANKWFFIRDTGLITRTLQAMGVESKVIMPLPYYEDDSRDSLIRTEYAHLSSTEWWKSLQIDALVLYSWGAPRYRKIAKAIRQAGIKLIIHVDTSGNFNPTFPPGTPLFRKIFTHLRIRLQDILRSKHLSYADVLTMSEPVAKVISSRLFYGKFIEEKCYPMPCPVAAHFNYEGQTKETRILAVGRWDDAVKRPQMLMDTLSHFYQLGGCAETMICGPYGDDMKAWYHALPEETKKKITIKGPTDNTELRDLYCRSQIVICTSVSEGTHIVSAEALCCGCSVVVSNRPRPLRNVLWYTCKNSGTISEEDTPLSLAKALQHELSLWKNGERNPHFIADTWQPCFRIDKVFNNILK